MNNFRYVAGVDEAGRGPLAGPVVAAAVILDPKVVIPGLDDSKKLGEKRRIELENAIKLSALSWSVAWASVEEIEKHNIVGATCLAMMRSIEKASEASGELWKPEKNSSLELFDENEGNEKGWAVLVDGRAMKKLSFKHNGLVKGDTKSLAIAMASMLAKVTRDRFMRELHNKFPEFGFDSNKGYGAPVHLKALDKLGPTVHHRPRFLRNILPQKMQEPDPVVAEQSQLSLL